jgi:transketolase
LRRAFIETLVELAERDPSVLLLTGDLGYTVVEPFAERFPDRFFNVGVAEQNMLGLATGLARSGMRPYAYSIATFASMRGYEFLRNGAVLHDLPVTLVGVGGGFDYGANGATHYALEDVALMRAQPGLAVVVPADEDQARCAVAAVAEVGGPVYLRLGKEGRILPGLDGRFRLGHVERIGEGEDVAIVACGPIAHQAVAAAALLEDQGLGVTVLIAASLAPPPVGDLVDVLGTVPLAVTLESHYTSGGLGSLVCEVVAEAGLGCRVIRRGVERLPSGEVGAPDWLERRHGLQAEQLARVALAELELPA